MQSSESTPSAQEAYELLVERLSTLGMGFSPRPELLEILKENLTADEARLLVLLPTRVAPLELATGEEIARAAGATALEVSATLEDLSFRNLVFSGETGSGQKGYALLQVGFGFPQTFFWKGEDTPHATKMAGLVAKYFNRKVTQEAYGGTETKPYRYVPLNHSIKRELQTVFPFHAMEGVLAGTRRFAVACCGCRVAARLNGAACKHPEEVCLKFDELADFVIERGLAREVTREEATMIVEESEKSGLVHFVDNAQGKVKHNCNCCGCSCWNVGSIRRRKIPRDVLMATYFLRETVAGACVGCGACATICPVAAVEMDGELPVVDREWCIGCGVCASTCPTAAVSIVLRTDRGEPPQDFERLHGRILREKGYR